MILSNSNLIQAPKLVTDGLVRYYDAGTNYVTGSYRWYDATNPINATPAQLQSATMVSRYVDNGINSYFDFNGTTNTLMFATPNATPYAVTGANPRSVFAVVYNRTLGDRCYFALGSDVAGNGAKFAVRCDVTSNKLRFECQGANYISSIQVVANKWYVAGCTFQGTTQAGVRLWQNLQSEQCTGTQAINTSNAYINLGATMGNLQVMDGYFASFIYYDRVLSNEEIAQNYEYFKTRYPID